MNKGYHLTKEIQKVTDKEREILPNKPTEEFTRILAITISDNRTLPNIKSTVEKH